MELGGLAGSGNLNLGSVAVTVGTDGDPTNYYSGSLSTNTTNPGSLIKSGSGTLTLSGNSNSYYGEYTGGMAVNGGTLLVTGEVVIGTDKTITVGPSGTLGGSGPVGSTEIDGDVVVNSSLQPGGTNGQGINGPLTIADSSIVLTINMTGAFVAQPDMGNDHYVTVSGNVSLNSATLSVVPTPGYTPAVGTIFNLIHVPPRVGAITGYFFNAPLSAPVIFADGQYFAISYTSSDVTMKVVAPPVAYVDTRWQGSNYPTGTFIPDADPVAGGNQPAVVGYSAFANVDAAIAAVSTSGTVMVNGADSTTGATGNFSTQDVMVDSGIALDVQDGAAQFGSLAGVGGASIALNGVNLTVGLDNANTVFAGLVSGTGSLTMYSPNAAGKMVLANAANSYSGGTNVQDGTIQVAADSDLGAGIVTGAYGGYIEFTLTTTTARSFAMSGGTVDVDAGQTLTFNGGEVIDGYLDGAGTFATGTTSGTLIKDVTIASSVAAISNNSFDQFVYVTNNGAFSLAAGVNTSGNFNTTNLNGFTNDTSGSVTIGNGSQLNVANFVSNGTVTLTPATGGNFTELANLGSSALVFGDGSQTYVGSAASPDPNVVGLDLHGQNLTITGGLFVNNGLLFNSLNNGSSTVYVEYGAIYKGAGTTNVPVVTENGGKVLFGNCPGTGFLGHLVFGPRGVNSYIFAIDDAAGVAGPSPDALGRMDGWSLANTDDFAWTADADNPLTVDLQTLAYPSTIGTEISGAMVNFDPSQSYSWTAVHWTGTYTGPTDVAALNAATNFDTSGVVNQLGGKFSWKLDAAAQTLSLVYTPPPAVDAVQLNPNSSGLVQSITVTFSTAVSFAGGNAAAAFRLHNLTDGNDVALAAIVSTNSLGQTVVTLTFSGGETDGAGNLISGQYALGISSADVTGANGVALDGNGTGVGNGINYLGPKWIIGG